MTTLQEAARQALEALTYQGSMGPTRRQRRHAAIESLRTALANEPQAEPVRKLTYEDADEIPCPHCEGTGTETSLSGGGPDAYDVEHDCSHCAGNQTLGAAYRTLIQGLKAAQKAHTDACARLYAVPSAEQPGAVGLSEQAIMHALDMARTDSHKQGDHALYLAFARRMWAQFEAQALAAAQTVAADPEDAARLQAKIENNQWDHISDFMPVFDAAMAGKWNWFENTDCKYVELWIDMRDGGCLIKNRRRERISPAQFSRQWSTATAATQVTMP